MPAEMRWDGGHDEDTSRPPSPREHDCTAVPGARRRVRRKVAGVGPDQWSDPSPCADWTARDVVGHVIDMHGVMLRPLDRQLSPAPSLQDDPLAAFRVAREDVEALLDDPELAAVEHDSPGGRRSVEVHVDQVVSEDLVLHGWDLARGDRSGRHHRSG
ncbi:MAG: maleylpyruvate isomerase family mycothiol-dependent enzyme [Geodermatophilaceae bacterium]